MVFFDLRKSYDRVPRAVIWYGLGRKKIPKLHIKLLKHMYEGAPIHVPAMGGKSDDIPNILVYIKVSQSPYPFVLVMDELTRSYSYG